MQNNFKSLGLSEDILKNLDSLSFHKMTNIQAMALPHVLKGVDVIAEAQTGSGKTVAFGLGVLSSVKVKDYFVQSMILCPTRELADQVATEIRKLARLTPNIKILTLCGGTSTRPQVESLQHGAHLVVGTPGRILDHIEKGSLSLKGVKSLVLDEADRMLDMGFADDIRAIIKKTPRSRQTLLFSATFPENIQQMSKDIQAKPLHIKAEKSVQNKDIQQLFFQTPRDHKYGVLTSLLQQYQPSSAIVFCTTKIQTQEVAKYLSIQKVKALALNGDLDQDERTEVVIRFANGSIPILVATDVASRGLDVKDVEAVIHFDLSKDPEVHVHRSGRTGRAGKKGLSLGMYSQNEEYRLQAIEKLINTTFTRNSKLQKSDQKSINIKTKMDTLKIFAGKKSKLRPGDILGALTKEANIDGKFIGKINILNERSYVAIDSRHIESAIRRLAASKIKNRNYRMKIM